MLLTLVYAVERLFRPRRRIAGMGTDSLAALVLHGIDVAVLFAITMTS
ncbi:hypothetical protein BTM25_34460 [Actinomadura rubteroloni]|uniref:Uncharacterized protein n=1 Tax=Actinomadura rubteroloni TaxID=1926885 RepID=A0A2P4UII1_9ACTN|nr:hypothetical protein [Actinomadura rubteroloni]POM24808.1 hypothetical protein BTM25_34460 [Actinomadura rubteroloni]